MKLQAIAGQPVGLRIDLPPRPEDYVELPEGFGRRFTVSIDTEEEFDWTKPLARGPHGTTHGRSLPAIQQLLGRAGVKPLYLVDYPIVADPLCVETLRGLQDSGECDVGTQLHPWVNPPFDETVCGHNSFAGNLDVELERAKLLTLTEMIESEFGRRPTVYRAGRYGIGPNSGRLLVEAGYRIDCSVRPLHDYSCEGGPDFSGVEPQPYWAADGELLEVPLTSAFIGALRSKPGLYRALREVPRAHGVLARSGMLTRVALSPEGMPLSEVRQAIERLLGDGVRLFSLSFHSPSIEVGHTPYVRDAADLREFHAWWDGVFDLFAARGVKPASIDDIYVAACAARRENLARRRGIG